MIEDESNPIVDILNEAMGKLKSIVDIDTVMGEPVVLPDGKTIIPITNIAMGFVAGGGEYPGAKLRHKDKYAFSGGSGAGFSIKPVGFLVSKDNGFEMITIADESAYKKLANVVADLAKTYIKSKEKNKKEEENAKKEQN